jgi:amidophosphoribosyltransferase
MPSRKELIATARSDAEICREIGADRLFYQELDDLKMAVQKVNQAIKYFDASCFDGDYITGDITSDYLNAIEAMRENGNANANADDEIAQLDLNLEANQ